MEQVNKTLDRIAENSLEMARKITEEGAALSELDYLIKQTKALIAELCNDSNPNVRKLGRANRRLFNASLQAQKLRERGNYSDKQLRRHIRKVFEARDEVNAIAEEVSV